MHDALLKALVKRIRVAPFLLAHISFVSSVSLNFLSSPQCRLDSRLEIFNVFVLEQEVKALDPFLLPRLLPLDLEALSWPEGRSMR